MKGKDFPGGSDGKASVYHVGDLPHQADDLQCTDLTCSVQRAVLTMPSRRPGM